MQTRNPVLLIHGIDDTATLFSTMAPYLEARGWQTHSLDLIPNDGTYGLEVLAQQVANYVNCTFTPDQPFDLVGFSMGGIISRYYLQRLGGHQRVERFVTIASPNQGTWTAYLRWNRGASQMRPDSAFLNDLNQDVAETLGCINVTSIWTPLDAMILPPQSSQLPVGNEVVVNVAAHAWMVTDLRVMNQVAIALSDAGFSSRHTAATAGSDLTAIHSAQ
ncbi:alpha/beta fold hydrolase [Leptolyngbya sp. FACHB-8]|uniref:esterase/lipase family protein n=1 Tax=unclassified Leptolyngbya TaxID=2650499 RepID=UPI001686F8B5|nr:alpha/beta fold hydrolase [Leptolyngbya sp. FACHB-8]MBD1909611.1 alpha/beta fold hydrolase [Leptolyngbya sp. FACHB-8]